MILLLVIMVLLISNVSFAYDNPMYDVEKVDDNINFVNWDEYNSVNLKYNLSKKSPDISVTSKMVWNSKFLIAKFVIEDDNIKTRKLVLTDRVWDDEKTYDIAELIFQPNKEKLDYYEFNLSPLGYYLIANVYWINDKIYWNEAIKGKDTIQKRIEFLDRKNDNINGWTLELWIPWEFMKITPQKGELMRGNFCRADSNLKDYLTWSSTETSFFHVPDKFGYFKLK